MGILCVQPATWLLSAARGFPLTKKVGIFAGTFDPMHDGHLAFAEAALNKGLDKVFFLVEPRPRRKQGVRALEHRLEMARLATASHKGFGVIHLEQAKFSPITTLPLLQARFKGSELVLLFGDDVVSHMVDHLTDWPHVAELAKSTSLLIALRRHQRAALEKRLKYVMRFGVEFRYDYIDLRFEHVSSSAIRQTAREGRALEGLPVAVASYIADNQLYASSS